jgi:hypothetical protein
LALQLEPEPETAASLQVSVADEKELNLVVVRIALVLQESVMVSGHRPKAFVELLEQHHNWYR